MRKVKVKFEHESQEEMGKYNLSRKIIYRDKQGAHTVTILAGDADSVNVYKEDDKIFVLSHNDKLGYIGIEVFKDEKMIGDIFFQGQAAEEILGPFNSSALTRIRKILYYADFL